MGHYLIAPSNLPRQRLSQLRGCHLTVPCLTQASTKVFAWALWTDPASMGGGLSTVWLADRWKPKARAGTSVVDLWLLKVRADSSGVHLWLPKARAGS